MKRTSPFLFFRRRTVAAELSAGLISATTLVMIALGIYSYHRDISFQSRFLKAKADNVTERLREAGALSLRRGDKKAVRAAVIESMRSGEVEQVRVVDAREKVIIERRKTRGAAAFRRSVPLRFEGVSYGRLEISFSDDSRSRVRRDLIIQTVVSVLLASIFIIFVTRFLLRRHIIDPVKSLTGGIKRIARGRYDAPLPDVSQRDIGFMVKLVNQMVRKIRSREETIRRDAGKLEDSNWKLIREVSERQRAETELRDLNERLEQKVAERASALGKLTEELAKSHWEMAVDVNLARAVQLNLLPGPRLTSGRISVSSVLQPMSELSGDIYEILELEPGRVAVLVADIMGHGLAAALVSMMVKVSFRNHAAAGLSPGETLKEMNDELFDSLVDSGGFFFTAFYGIIDEHKGELLYAGAGHGDALIYCADDHRITALPPRGPGIGILEDSLYYDEVEKLNPGDKIVVHSDGLVDQLNDAEEPFGANRLHDLIREFGSGTAVELREKLLRAYMEFKMDTPSGDDTTLLVAEIGKPGPQGD